MTQEIEKVSRLAVRVLHDFRRRDGLTCYARPENQQRDEANMMASFQAIVAPAITALSSSPSREKELPWLSHVDALSALHPSSECEGATCPICKALVAVTYAFHERDRATLTENASTSEGERA